MLAKLHSDRILVVDLVQGSPEWLAYRDNHLNASEAGAVMGCNPWFPKNVHDLIAVKKGLKKVEYTKAMQHGNDSEETARKALNALLGIEGKPIVLSYGQYSASLDWCHTSTKERAIGEIKCPFSANSDYWMAALSGQVKEYAPAVYWQMQHQMFVSGHNQCHFFVWSAENQSHCIVERDETDIRALLVGWEKYQQLMEAKESDELADVIEIYKAKSFEMEVLKAELEAAKEALLLSAGDNYDGHGIKIRTTSRIGAVDYAKIPELKGVDLDQYRKPPTTTTTIKIEKE